VSESTKDSAQIDERFYDRADEHIQLSNVQINATETRGKVSASMLYATARFNAWVSATGFASQLEMREGRETRLDFLCDQYRKMLQENYDDYVENFDDYLKPHA
jgi:Protein of unknown function (DUF3144)